MIFLYSFLIFFVPFFILFFVIINNLLFSISNRRIEKAINNVLELNGYYNGNLKNTLKKKLMMYYYTDNMNNYRKIQKKLKQIEKGEI